MDIKNSPFIPKVGGANPDSNNPGMESVFVGNATIGDFATFATGISAIAANLGEMKIQALTEDALTTSCGTTSGSTAITFSSGAFTGGVGSTVSGTGIPAGTTIVSIDSLTGATLSAKATATGTATLTFGPGKANWIIPVLRTL